MVPINKRRKYERFLETRETVQHITGKGERPITNLERFARATFIAGVISTASLAYASMYFSHKDKTFYNSSTEIGRIADTTGFFTLGTLLFYLASSSIGEYNSLKKLQEE